jgi:hypothetical protein
MFLEALSASDSPDDGPIGVPLVVMTRSMTIAMTQPPDWIWAGGAFAKRPDPTAQFSPRYRADGLAETVAIQLAN